MCRRKRGTLIQGIAWSLLFVAVCGWAQENFLRDNPATFNKLRVAKTFMYKGRQYFLKGKYQKAEKAFNRCLRDFHQFADAYYYLALIYSGRKSYLQALKYIKKADANFLFMDNLEVKARLRAAGGFANLDHVYRMNRAQKRASYSVCYGNILIQLKKFVQAEPHFLVAVKHNPKDLVAYHNLITLLTVLKKYIHAFSRLRDAEFYGHKIADKLRNRVANNFVLMAEKRHKESHYVEAYQMLKLAEGGHYTVKPRLAQTIVKDYETVAQKLPTEAHSLITKIVNLCNARDYQKAWGKINLAESKGIRIGENIRKIIRQQLKKNNKL